MKYLSAGLILLGVVGIVAAVWHAPAWFLLFLASFSMFGLAEIVARWAASRPASPAAAETPGGTPAEEGPTMEVRPRVPSDD